MSFFSSESKHNTLSDEQNCFLPWHLSFWELPGWRGRAYLCAEDVVFALHSGCSKDGYQWAPVHCSAGEGAPSSGRTKSLQFCLRLTKVELKWLLLCFQDINVCILENYPECSNPRVFYIIPYFCGQHPQCRYALSNCITRRSGVSGAGNIC